MPATLLCMCSLSVIIHPHIFIPSNLIQIAELNLMAGKSCTKTSSFHSAAEYFTNGIALLPDDCFDNDYGLSIELYDSAQNALYLTGDFTMMSLLSSKLLENAKCFDDKVNSCEC